MDTIPEKGIIDTALKKGYSLNKDSNNILLGEEAKSLILKYIGMQKDVVNSKDNYLNRGLDTSYRVTWVIEALDENMFKDEIFAQQLIDLALQKGYVISGNSPKDLLKNPKLAEKYYENLLNTYSADLKQAIEHENILSAELLNDKEFLANYIKLLKQKEIPNNNILKTLIQSKECAQAIKEDSELLQIIFENIEPSDLESFFEKFYSKEELKEFFKQNDKLQGKLLKISKLYNRDDTVLETLDFRMLDEKFENIPEYKMQIIAKNEKVQKELIGLDPYKLNLYDRMTQLVSTKTNRWNRFEQNILENLIDGYYNELITDLYEQAQAGDKINQEDIETLTFLFQKNVLIKISGIKNL